MEVMEAILKRRSIRKYKDKPVEKETIEMLLKAATAAPSACNRQPWEFIVVDQVEILDKFKQHLLFARYNAPVGIIVCGNMKLALCGADQDMWVQDCSAATENILIAATGYGLGSVWIGIYPVKSRMDMLKKQLNIPDHVIPLGMIYIGYPDEEKEPRTQYNEKRVYWNEYDSDRKHRKSK